MAINNLRSAGKSEVVVKLVLSKPELFDDVIDAIFIADAGTRMRASDAVEKITRDHPEWLKPYKKRFLNDIANIEQKEVRWHTAQILPRLNLTKLEREKVYKLMHEYLNDKSSIVRTFAMQALTDIALQENKYINEVRRLIEDLMRNGSPAMKSRGKKLLTVLNKV